MHCVKYPMMVLNGKHYRTVTINKNTVMYNIFGVGSTENIEISNIHTNQQSKL